MKEKLYDLLGFIALIVLEFSIGFAILATLKYI